MDAMGCRKNAILHPEMQKMKWMQQACRHFHTGSKACIVDSVELHSFLPTLLYHAMDLLVGGYVTGSRLAQDR